MNPTHLYFGLIPLISFIIEGFTFTYILAQGSKSAINTTFLILSGFITIWIFQDVITAFLPFPDSYVIPGFKMICFTWLSSGLLFTIFTYHLLKKKIDFIIYIIAIIAVISIIVTVTTDLAFAGIEITPIQRTFKEGKLFMPLALFSLFLPFIYCFILLIKRIMVEPEEIFKKQILFVVIGTGLSFVITIYLNIVGPVILKYELYRGAGPAVVHSIFIFIAITKYKFFSMGVQEVANDLFSKVTDGIILMSNDKKIIQINEAAKDILQLNDMPSAKTVNKDVESIDLAEIIDEYSFQNEYKGFETLIKSNGDIKHLSLSQSPVIENNVPIGKMLIIRDITESKKRELEIKDKNLKIQQSINYASRIQGSIIPTEELINKYFSESFLLLKPKDVVSGDFPWFIEKGDNIYLAVVDCTGHGVPGALMSFIGYFLLSEIMAKDENNDPANILQSLSNAVKRTLKQDDKDSPTRDGMDVALCKINIKKKEIQYAGAHHPLYLIQNGNFNEIKGDRLTVGGIYHIKSSFTNHVIKYKTGDSIFLMSDGFPDQFGGSENRKFSRNRLREIIRDNHHLKMKDMSELLNNKFEDWRGNYKQIDDVLVMGLKL